MSIDAADRLFACLLGFAVGLLIGWASSILITVSYVLFSGGSMYDQGQPWVDFLFPLLMFGSAIFGLLLTVWRTR